MDTKEMSKIFKKYNKTIKMTKSELIEKWEKEHTFDCKCGNDSYIDDDMVAFRIGIFNILITSKPDYFRKWQLATKLAIRLNLTKKEDRKILFKKILEN